MINKVIKLSIVLALYLASYLVIGDVYIWLGILIAITARGAEDKWFNKN